MLLRASSVKAGDEAKLEGAIGQGDGGVPHGAALIRFGEAVSRGSADVERARADLIQEVGREAFIEAAAVVGIFNGLVRTADSTGIPLDDGTRDSTADFRADLGLDAFRSAANTDLAATDPAGATPDPERAFR